MKIINEINKEFDAIFWDFDGVLMNSNEIRDKGFEEVLKEYPVAQVAKLMQFHQKNGGLSRYVKFRYFFEEIRGEQISDEEVQQWADRFSIIMKNLLIDPSLIVKNTIDFVKANHKNVDMHIVSGSDQQELRHLCKVHGIDKYFKRIHGSPTSKKVWIGEILKEHGYAADLCVLIGDSINDHEAAMEHGLNFIGYNNEKVEALTTTKFLLF